MPKFLTNVLNKYQVSEDKRIYVKKNNEEFK